MKRIFHTTIVLFLAIVVSEKMMAQSSNKPISFKNIFDSRKADKILTQEIKKKELLQTPSLINLTPVKANTTPKQGKVKNWFIILP